VYIEKEDGRQRPLGVAAVEDKTVQYAVATILNQIYEEDFLGFSYGFRPGRGQHDALDALSYALLKKKVNYILDADIASFFDNLDKSWMLKFVEHRVADPRILRLIQKWLKAGVMEEGKWSEPKTGSPQGSVISPLLANIYLHYAFDLWVNVWRKKWAQGEVVVVRYADDTIVGFQYQADADRFLENLRERLAKFGLNLHPDKTRRIEFGRYAVSADLRGSHFRRYVGSHQASEVTSEQTSASAARPCTRGAARIASFFPAQTNHQLIGILPRRPSPQELPDPGVFVIRPGRLDDQVLCARTVGSACRCAGACLAQSEGQFPIVCVTWSLRRTRRTNNNTNP
jgi:group II intron reverse transcriptase/maturase